MSTARRRLAASLDRVAAGARRRAGSGRRDARDTDLVIAAILAREDAAGLVDPTGFVRFLRECFGTARFSVTDVAGGAGAGAGEVRALRFQTLIDQLSSGAPAVDQADAIRIGRIADELLARTEPFDRENWAADVGIHARVASSFGRKGRLLSTLVRVMRVERTIEIGTAYGMSALFLAAAMGERGRLVTAERSQPQLGIAEAVLGREHPGSVTVLGGISTDLAAAARERLGSADFLFHDGEHSRRAYVEDFTAFEPLLDAGAVVLYDDIDWRPPRGGQTDTYAGWREVVAHPRVRRAVEVDRELGLLLLR
jgi:predicted O-methyltransferase YrrM